MPHHLFLRSCLSLPNISSSSHHDLSLLIQPRNEIADITLSSPSLSHGRRMFLRHFPNSSFCSACASLPESFSAATPLVSLGKTRLSPKVSKENFNIEKFGPRIRSTVLFLHPHCAMLFPWPGPAREQQQHSIKNLTIWNCHIPEHFIPRSKWYTLQGMHHPSSMDHMQAS